MTPQEKLSQLLGNKSDRQLLNIFKWGNAGESEFISFMSAVREVNTRLTLETHYQGLREAVQEFVSTNDIRAEEDLYQRDGMEQRCINLVGTLLKQMEEASEKTMQMPLELEPFKA